MFISDHRRDFDTVLAAVQPFALVRFGDGEAAILGGTKHKAANGEWTAHGPHWLRDDLHASLVRDAPDYCVGLPPRCCLPTVMHLHADVRVPNPQRTLATLFLHGNLHRMTELRARLRPILVGATLDIDVPRDGMDRSAVDLDHIVGSMLSADRPLLVAAGPLANVLIDRYWQRQTPQKRQIVLDVGSALDVVLHGRRTRSYHEGPILQHHCTLNAAPLVAGRPAVSAGIISVSTRGHMITTRPAPSRRAPTVRPRTGGTTVVRSSVSTATAATPNPTSTAPSPSTTTTISSGPRKRCTTCLKVIRNRK